MKTLKRTSLLLALGAALALAACGGDDEEGAPIPSDQVQLLEGRLTETENRLGDGSLGACEDILNDTMPEVTRVLDSVPSDVDPDVRSALQDSFDRLWQLVEDECRDREAEEPAEPAPDPEPTPPETETESETAPPDTETAPVDPEEETVPPDGDGDNGGLIPEGEGGPGGGVGPGGGEGGE